MRHCPPPALPLAVTALLISTLPSQIGLYWQEVVSPLRPPALVGAGVAFDAARLEAVLFSGMDHTATPRDDTWLWNGADWRLAQPANQPQARQHHAMAFDPNRSRVVMFGGRQGANWLADTWEWNGIDWTELQPAATPAPRLLHRMAWDGVRQEVLAFGGLGTNATIYGDTWSWDGAAWTQQLPPTSPSARRAAAMAHDPGRNVIVLHGGNESPTDTWEWDGSNWHDVTPTGPGPQRRGHTMAYDPSCNAVVLAGGIGAETDTWSFNGQAWTPFEAEPAPPLDAGLFHDPTRGELMAIGTTFSQTLSRTRLYRLLDSVPVASYLEFQQIDFAFTGVGAAQQPDSEWGLVTVHTQALPGPVTGYLNVWADNGWVVQNLWIDRTSHHPRVGKFFTLPVPRGTDITVLSAYVAFTKQEQVMFQDGPRSNWPVVAQIVNNGGVDGVNTGIGSAPRPNMARVIDPGEKAPIWTGKLHNQIEEAENQCVPASVTNSLDYLKKRFGLPVPHGFASGGNQGPVPPNDNTIVGWLDYYMGRQTGKKLLRSEWMNGKALYWLNHLAAEIPNYSHEFQGAGVGNGATHTYPPTHGLVSHSAGSSAVTMEFLHSRAKCGDVEVILEFGTPSAPQRHAVRLTSATKLTKNGEGKIRVLFDLRQDHERAHHGELQELEFDVKKNGNELAVVWSENQNGVQTEARIVFATAEHPASPVKAVQRNTWYKMQLDDPAQKVRKAKKLSDLNGNGYPEYLINTPNSSNVWVEALGADPHRVHIGGFGDEFGEAMTALGDCDADGVRDYAITAPQAAAGSGRVQAFSGATGELLWSVTGPTPNALYGASIDRLGDIDNDNVPDVVVGAAADGQGGAFDVISGRTGTRIDYVQSATLGASLGFAVAGVGDHNNDNVADLAVGAPGAAGGDGEVRLYSGFDRSLLTTLTGAPGSGFGRTIARVGDIDGDDEADFAVGMPYANQVDLLSVTSPQNPLHTWNGAGGLFGYSVTAGGDFDMDTRPDVVIGAPTANDTGSSSGEVYVYSTDGAQILHIEAPAGMRGFGFYATDLGDVNRDGVDDLFVSAFEGSSLPGGYAIFSGANVTPFGRSCGSWPELAPIALGSSSWNVFAGQSIDLYLHTHNAPGPMPTLLIQSSDLDTTPNGQPVPGMPQLPDHCRVFVDLASAQVLAFFLTDAEGHAEFSLPLPSSPWLDRLPIAFQAAVLHNGLILPTNAVKVTIGL